MERYFGAYKKLIVPSEVEVPILMSADVLVGDFFRIEIEFADDVHKAWLISRFDQRIGHFDANFSRQLSVYVARGFEFKAILSYLAVTSKEEGKEYWGEMAVMGYEQRFAEEVDVFSKKVAARIGEGVRPRIDLSEALFEQMVKAKGSWEPKDTVTLPKLKKGSAYLKDKLSANDKMVEQARKGNKLLYVVGYGAIFLFIALIVFGLKSCGVF